MQIGFVRNYTCNVAAGKLSGERVGGLDLGEIFN